MDSLIVLRKPLRKTQLEAKCTVPRRSKRSAPKVEPIPTEPGLASDPRYEPAISFVRLWRARAGRPAAAHHPSPALSRATSASQLAPGPAPARRATAELVLELDYTPALLRSAA